MDKFSSEVHRVHMELGGNLLNSLRIDRLARSYGIQKLLRRRKNLGARAELDKSIYHYCCKKKVSPHNFLKKRIEVSTVPELYDASEPVYKNGRLTCFAERAVSIRQYLP
jgi:hypothetical protein